MSHCEGVYDVCGLSIYNMFYSTYFVYIIVSVFVLEVVEAPRPLDWFSVQEYLCRKGERWLYCVAFIPPSHLNYLTRLTIKRANSVNVQRLLFFVLFLSAFNYL